MAATTTRRRRPAPEPTLDLAEDTRARVDGLAVVETEPIASNLARTPGRAGVVLKINRLTLEDGSYRFGCAEADCEFVAAQRGEVQSHRQQTHGAGRTRARAATGVSAEVAALSFMEVVALAEAALSMETAFDELNTAVAHWRERANSAERRLSQIESTLGRLIDK